MKARKERNDEQDGSQWWNNDMKKEFVKSLIT
jgi:hypothetical protein